MAAHKRIWAWPAFGPESVTGSWSANTYHDERTVAYILAAEHDRIVAEKDAEIARLHDKLCVVKMVIETLLARLETARNDALDAAAISALKGGEE